MLKTFAPKTYAAIYHLNLEDVQHLQTAQRNLINHVQVLAIVIQIT